MDTKHHIFLNQIIIVLYRRTCTAYFQKFSCLLVIVKAEVISHPSAAHSKLGNDRACVKRRLRTNPQKEQRKQPIEVGIIVIPQQILTRFWAVAKDGERLCNSVVFVNQLYRGK